MQITKRMQKAIEETKREFAKSPEFTKLSEFYQEMQSAGIAKKQEYTLPPLDTIGRRLNQHIVVHRKKN